MFAAGAIKVAIVEDQREIRDGLSYLLQRSEGCELLGSYGSLEEALPCLSQALPDVLLLDIGLPGMNGIEGTRLLKARWPELVVVTLTVYDDDDRVFAALCAGASGYLLKNTTPARLIESLREAVNGGAPISPEIASKVLRLFREIRPPARADYHLTPHELRLLKLLVEGHSYKTAAAELKSCVNTVSFHMKNIYRKLEVHSKSEAVAKVLQQRLI
ncbi:MAG: response regulator transcription factor [Acidobacteria bacterium]|nr:response regulator transcription factor [Acidobacteriota bacterium]